MATTSNRDTYFWYIEGERIAIVEKKTTYAIDENTDPKWQSPTSTSAGKKILVSYSAKPTAFTTDIKKSSEIPSQFHEALAYKVISELYKIPGEKFNLQLAQYFDQQYLLAVREAKKYARTQHTSGGQIVPHEY